MTTLSGTMTGAAVWVGGVLYKISEVDFVYEYTDPEARETTGWRVESPDLGGGAVAVAGLFAPIPSPGASPALAGAGRF
jgi:hypothetical protein